MGKKWMMGKKQGDKGGNKNDMSSCRGYSIVLATCDAAREREANKELTTLLLQEIEKIDADNKINNNNNDNNNDNNNNDKSIQSLLEEELQEIRGQRHEGTQQIMSINTGCKGLVLCKIKNKALCPVDLVRRIFNRVKSDKQPISRWVSRIIPLTYVFFPNESELDANIRIVLEQQFPGIVLPPMKEFDTDKKPNNSANNNDEDDATVSIPLVDASGIISNSVAQDDTTNNTTDITDATDDKVVDEKGMIEASSTSAEPDTNDTTNNTTDIADAADDKVVGEKRTMDESSSTSAEPDTNDNIKRVRVENPYANKPNMYYGLQFKQRNHTVVTKNMTFEALKRNSPSFLKASFRYDMKVQYSLIVEVFMNLGGISCIDGNDELVAADFNLRRLQTQLFGPPPESTTKNSKNNKSEKPEQNNDSNKPNSDEI